MAVEISWSYQAEYDLQDLILFVCADGSVAAEEFVAALLEKIELRPNSADGTNRAGSSSFLLP